MSATFMILDKLKSLFRKIRSKKRIFQINKSPYFDKKYYLSHNPDVEIAKIPPSYHFYHFGWKENRNPNANFSIEKFLERYPEAAQLQMDPITYIRYKGIEQNTQNITKEVKIKVSDLLQSYFSENLPLKTLPVGTQVKRFNIIFNGFDKGCFFAGKATALILAIKFAEKYGYNLRIISQDPDKAIFDDFLKLFELTFTNEVEFYSTESTQFLEVGDEDHFLCTMWTNADSILNTNSITGRIFYIMQEVETFFYDQGDYHLRSFNTLTNNTLIPIVNSNLLFDYLSTHGYDNLKNGISFEPSFSTKLLSPSEENFKKKGKYKLFFYARPSHQRNLFYFGIDILNKAFTKGILDPNKWEVYLAGDKTIPNFDFDVSVKVYNKGIVTWDEYYKLASEMDLCYTMIYTPHPSYIPFDFVRSGAVVLTNKYANKKDLHEYSKNIISADLNEKDMLEKLKQGSVLAQNSKKREENYHNSNILDSWDKSFEKVLPFMEAKIRGSKDV